MAEDRLIPVLAMTLDPRLRRLFALVGLCLAEEDLYAQEDALYSIMLDLAPEYLPPEDPDSDEVGQWQEMIDQGIAGTPGS